MFLDEKLFNIAKYTDIHSQESVITQITLMIQACFTDLIEKCGNTTDVKIIKTQFNRVNNVWCQVYDKLDKDGYCFFKRDGFKTYVSNQPKFKGLLG